MVKRVAILGDAPFDEILSAIINTLKYSVKLIFA